MLIALDEVHLLHLDLPADLAPPQAVAAPAGEGARLPGAELGKASAVLEKLSAQRATLVPILQKRVGDLRKKESHNIRALEALVPKREVYAKEKQRARDIEETVEDPLEGSRRRRAPRKRPDQD